MTGEEGVGGAASRWRLRLRHWDKTISCELPFHPCLLSFLLYMSRPFSPFPFLCSRCFIPIPSILSCPAHSLASLFFRRLGPRDARLIHINERERGIDHYGDRCSANICRVWSEMPPPGLAKVIGLDVRG